MNNSALMLAPKSFRPERQKLLGALIFVLSPFFFLSAPLWLLGEAGPALSNLAHIVFFAVLAALVDSRLPLSTPRRWLLASLAVLAITGLIESIQFHIGRTASWHDALRNLLGCWLALFWLGSGRKTVWLGRIITGLLLLVELSLLAQPILQQYSLSQRLPLISNLEAATELNHWQATNSIITRSSEASSEGDYGLKVELGAASYSGVALKTLPRNWSGHKQFLLDIYNPAASQPVELTLRIHDRQHHVGANALQYNDRFNRRIKLEAGWNRIEIPLEEIRAAPRQRSMDLRHISELRLFAPERAPGRVFYVDNVRLRVE